jgi:hypothetical protein
MIKITFMNSQNNIGRLIIIFLSCLIPFRLSGFTSLALTLFGLFPRITRICFQQEENREKTEFGNAVKAGDYEKVISIFETSKKNNRPINPDEEIVHQYDDYPALKTSPLVNTVNNF